MEDINKWLDSIKAIGEKNRNSTSSANSSAATSSATIEPPTTIKEAPFDFNLFLRREFNELPHYQQITTTAMKVTMKAPMDLSRKSIIGATMKFD